MARFPFNDLHSFKDYIGFVKLCSPDLFPNREGVGLDEQWSLSLAFQGLREGFAYLAGKRDLLATCIDLTDRAYSAYVSGEARRGYELLEEMHCKVKAVRSQ
ncbi:hypothetical protein [uncultured Pseudoxanthomonas sp.]|uniref:hypothetical protein n=1 Tax=uncultured Pseudoxanthomonas sp. TaxID=281701 RepID=UPI002629A222|nr:hypothetical protein [uncultured Pseudoxanthomonas sp.]